MKKTILFLIWISALCFLSKTTNAQTWAWAKGISGTGINEAWNVCTDNKGHAYITGYFFQPTITFGSETLTNAGLYDIFLAKYDSLGNVLWARSAGGTAYDWSNDVKVDNNGNVFITGLFQSPTITFGSFVLTNPSGSPDIFLAKYDSLGNVLWAKSAGGTGQDIAKSISTDSSGNVYMTGNFMSPTIVFGTDTLINNGYTDVFLVKYDANGNVVWATNPKCTFYDEGTSVATDPFGNIFVTGYFQNVPIIFGSDTLTNTGGSDPFIVKYNSAGNVIWAKSIEGTASDVGNALSTDAFGNVYITGYFQSPSINIDTFILTNSGSYDVYIAKYNPAGNVLWAQSAGGSSTDYAWCISTDAKNNVYMTGGFSSSSITFAPFTLARPVGSCDALFVVKYNSDGRVICAFALASGGDDNCGISTDNSGNTYIGGDFFCSPFIIGADTFYLGGPSSENIFIAKFIFDCEDVSVNELSNEGEIIIYPNPTTDKFTIKINSELKLQHAKMQIYNMMGEEVFSKSEIREQNVEINCSAFAAGIYFARVSDGEKMFTQKLVVE